VTQHWVDTETHLRTNSKNSFFRCEFEAYLNGKGWADRIYRQLTDLHWAAFYLDPLQATEKITPATYQALQKTNKAVYWAGGSTGVLLLSKSSRRLL
jgi:hypothetical protein